MSVFCCGITGRQKMARSRGRLVRQDKTRDSRQISAWRLSGRPVFASRVKSSQRLMTPCSMRLSRRSRHPLFPARCPLPTCCIRPAACHHRPEAAAGETFRRARCEGRGALKRWRPLHAGPAKVEARLEPGCFEGGSLSLAPPSELAWPQGVEHHTWLILGLYFRYSSG